VFGCNANRGVESAAAMLPGKIFRVEWARLRGMGFRELAEELNAQATPNRRSPCVAFTPYSFSRGNWEHELRTTAQSFP
jgi:hypothetical protein